MKKIAVSLFGVVLALACTGSTFAQESFVEEEADILSFYGRIESGDYNLLVMVTREGEILLRKCPTCEKRSVPIATKEDPIEHTDPIVSIQFFRYTKTGNTCHLYEFRNRMYWIDDQTHQPCTP